VSQYWTIIYSPGRIWSGDASTFVEPDDASFAAFLAAGGQPTPIGLDAFKLSIGGIDWCGFIKRLAAGEPMTTLWAQPWMPTREQYKHRYRRDGNFRALVEATDPDRRPRKSAPRSKPDWSAFLDRLKAGERMGGLYGQLGMPTRSQYKTRWKDDPEFARQVNAIDPNRRQPGAPLRRDVDWLAALERTRDGEPIDSIVSDENMPTKRVFYSRGEV
jgi:hypothetical protein